MNISIPSSTSYRPSSRRWHEAAAWGSIFAAGVFSIAVPLVQSADLPAHDGPAVENQIFAVAPELQQSSTATTGMHL